MVERRASSLFLWVTVDENGREGILAKAVIPELAPVPMVTTREHVARSDFWVELATSHALFSGRPVRLVRFDRREIVLQWPP